MNKLPFEVQTRSETGEIRTFAKLYDAVEFAKHDRDVWKISFSIESGERVRLIRVPDQDSFVLSFMADEVENILRESGRDALADLIRRQD